MFHCVMRLFTCCVTFGVLASSTRANDGHAACRKIDSGHVCGVERHAENGVKYISYRGVPYAKQPINELRFKELQPVELWSDRFHATEEGPICPQYDEIYGRMMKPQKGMSEACIYANIHVPIVADCDRLPIFVFIHGGAFQSGSGDSDVYGPEYLVSKGMIIMTFNYRSNVFGFFSMSNKQFPGNYGLRDILTFLRWVRRNAAALGGDPDDVTLGGHSAGAAAAHLLSLSEASEGLFKRLILMSGTAIPAFYSSSPSYATLVAQKLLTKLGINSTDPDHIHSQIVHVSTDAIMKAYRSTQTETGFVSFVPVVEGSYEGVTRILDDDPIKLIKQGRGKNLPILIGFTSIECEAFRSRIVYRNFVEMINKNNFSVLPMRITDAVTPLLAQELDRRVHDKYFKGKVTLDDYIKYCTDTLFIYPAFKLAQWRSAMDDAPVFLYQFSFDSTFNVVKEGLSLKYDGGGAHIEDLTNIFRTNSMLGSEKSFPPWNRDTLMKDWMTEFVANFIKCDNPFCGDPSAWPSVDTSLLNYQVLLEPITIPRSMPATDKQRSMIEFFDNIEMMATNLTSLQK